ncbi:MAG: serine hydrolase domain-containing protein [Steroidobacteraceae bacterium]
MKIAVVEAEIGERRHRLHRYGGDAPASDLEGHIGILDSAVGSETKAFTSAALAMLVDEGKLKWTDRVVDKLPGFRMYDPYVTAHMTVRDLLTHRTGLGLGEGDLLITPTTSRDRANIVHALRYLKPRTGFREVFAYDNITYIAAGALVQAVSGETWEHFVEQHIFAPLGMTDSRTLYDPTAPNAVALHGRTDGPIRGIGRERILTQVLDAQAAAPCGSINASAVDMGKWMAMWEERGKLPGGKHLLSAAAVHELWNPIVVVPTDAFGALSPLLAGPILQDYALGWFVEDDYGHTVVEHTGAVFGALAALYIIPDKHVAFSVSIFGSQPPLMEFCFTPHLVSQLHFVYRDEGRGYPAFFTNLARYFQIGNCFHRGIPSTIRGRWI